MPEISTNPGQKKFSVIVKPTHSCNLACEYCYVDLHAEKGVMSETTLQKVIKQAVELYPIVSFIWHGGEPLLMPLNFYRTAVEIQAELQREYPERKISNGFQTNGTLVTDEVLDFCEQNKFRIGFSLDGPKEINDKTRHYKDGSSSFDLTLEAIKKTRQRKIGGGAIVIINRLNIDDLLEIYEFAKKEQIRLKINSLIKSGNAIGNYNHLGIGPDEYGQALAKLFDIWFYDNSKINISPFEEIMGNILTGETWGCNYSASCQNDFISVGPQGDIYPCGRFDGVPGFRFGNINREGLASVLECELRLKMKERSRKVEECQPCEYRKICNSGCMHNAYMMNGNIFNRDFYCESYTILFRHIDRIIGKELIKAEIK